MAMKILNKQMIVNTAKVFGAVGGGFVTAKVGGNLAVRMSKTVGDFVANATDPLLAKGHVDMGAGVLLDAGILAGAAALKLMSPMTAARAAPFMVAGSAMEAYGPVLAEKVVTKIEAFFDGFFAETSGQVVIGDPVVVDKAGGMVIDMPVLRNAGGLVAKRQRGIGLGGELKNPGGLVAQQRGNNRVGLGGELRRPGGKKPGGLYASRGFGPRLGGEVR